MNYIKFFDEITIADVSLVGGKNASLGQMIRALPNIPIPYGFALTADAYRKHIEENNLLPQLHALIAKIEKNSKDTEKLSAVGAHIRKLITDAPVPTEIEKELRTAYELLSKKYHTKSCDVAVRSSATAEDLPTASFAGQQDTYLHITNIEELLKVCSKAFASLFTDRAIIYRQEKGFDHFKIALSLGIQKMVRSDRASSGVMFTLDTETGFKDAIIINSAYGLGETVVQGIVTPDEFVVFKPLLQENFRPLIKKVIGSKEKKLVYKKKELKSVNVPKLEQKKFSLTDDEIFILARYGIEIENHYSAIYKQWSPMDIEWAKDGKENKIYIVQARPETIHRGKQTDTFTYYSFEQKLTAKPILTGQSIGKKIVAGTVRVIAKCNEIEKFNAGDILVTSMTNPDWVPIMKKAAAIVTDRGGRTCHAAIVSRELGISAVIGTGTATKILKNEQKITVDCSEGSQGFIYDRIFKATEHVVQLVELPQIPSKLLINLADPHGAFDVSFLPVDGVGLARLEFIISTMIRIHPMAIAQSQSLPQTLQKKIEKLTKAYKGPRTFYIDTLAESVGMIAAAFFPKPVIVRLTDFKSNEYHELLGGEFFEPQEENPMLGFRGAVRYCSPRYAPAFELECAALKKAREVMGFTNIKIMVPFVRTVDEARQTIKTLADNGLMRGTNNLEIYMMVEIPSNVILIEEFARLFDGFSIGSNDLTQLTLGVDRDSGLLSELFDERDPAAIKMLEAAVKGAQKAHIPIGICGQAPSDFPDLAEFLIKLGIDSLSLNTDAVIPFLINFKRKK